MTQILNVTKDIHLAAEQKKVVSDVATDLQCIKKAIPELEEVVVRGGFFADIYFGTTPSDIDLFYSLKGTDKKMCRCDYIRSVIDKLELHVIKKRFDYDLENSFEKEPRHEPIERTVGLDSYHTDWMSMFCITDQAETWTNPTSFQFLCDNIYEVRYEGFIPWGFYPRNTDAKNYFLLYGYVLVRGLSHLQRRGHQPGPQFLELISRWEYLVSKIEEYGLYSKLENYAKSKIGSMEDVNKLIMKYAH